MSRIPDPNFTFEQLVEALEKSRGFILAAKKYLFKVYNIQAGYRTIKSCVRMWGMEEWLDDIRKSLVEDCLSKTFAKGIAEGDNHCIFWVLEKYGHHLDFLDGIETEQESKKGWRELLGHVKGTPESNTETKLDREHSQT
jgi:hypothetical protein